MKFLSCVVAALLTLAWAGGVYAEDLFNMSLSDLKSVEVTSVAKKPQTLDETAAAVTVVSAEEIRRSGATSIPEALRLVPGVEVARIDANKWAVSVRGFNGRFANKLLVLMDGRTVYSLAFSGVLWNNQLGNLDDIERIEVIRGPGAAVWGTNAVNGVINIITKSTKKTQGTYLATTAGTEEQAALTLRYGGGLGDTGSFRIFGQGRVHDDFTRSEGGDQSDEWTQGQIGMRTDLYPGPHDEVMLQAFYFNTREDGQQVLQSLSGIPRSIEEEITQQGGYFLARWTHTTDKDHQWTLQGSVELTDIDPVESTGFFNGMSELEARYQWPLDNHAISFGANYKHYWDSIESDFTTTFSPPEETLNFYGLFAQDEIKLADALTMTVGARADHNPYSEWEWSASARLAWQPMEGHTLWSAVSRAIRPPSRGEIGGRNVFSVTPGLPTVIVAGEGNEDFDSEELVALDLGYRFQPDKRLYLDLAFFLNDYESLRTIETRPVRIEDMGLTIIQPLQADNKMKGLVYGAEAALTWQVTPSWRLQPIYSFLEMDLELEEDSQDSTSVSSTEGSSATHRWAVRSSHDLGDRWQLDLWLKYVGPLATGDVDSYFGLDARLAWKAKPGVTVALVGQNLLDPTHPEITPELLALGSTEVDRGVYLKVECRF